MKSVYMTALSPEKGADGDLKRFQISCTEDFGWHSPLPLMVPLALWSASFPRDRVSSAELKTLPPLELTGPVFKEDHIILQMKDREEFENSVMFREIHGKNIPPQEKISFINWEGLLLQPGKIETVSQFQTRNQPIEKIFQFRRWQLGLYKLRYDETRNWWEDLHITSLWKVRKPS